MKKVMMRTEKEMKKVIANEKTCSELREYALVALRIYNIRHSDIGVTTAEQAISRMRLDHIADDLKSKIPNGITVILF